MTTAEDSAARGAPLLSTHLGRAAVVVLLAAVFVAALALSGWLQGPPVKDEGHFIESARSFREPFPPTLAQLRGYAEVINPLAFVAWGQLDRFTRLHEAHVQDRLADAGVPKGMRGAQLDHGKP